MRPRTTETQSLQSVEHALVLLEALAEGGELGVSELGAILGRSPSGAYRLLATLERRGYVQQVPRGRKYRLGMKLFELSASYARSLDVREVAHPVLGELARLSGETAYLSVFDRGESVNIDTVESPRAVQARAWVGTRTAAYATSTGKVLLAFQSVDVVEQVIARGLQAHTANTCTDPAALRRELAAVRERGYAVNVGGWREDAAGVAAPVHDARDVVVAAISLVGPLTRLDEARLAELVTLTRKGAREISERLGWVRGVVPVGAARAPSLFAASSR